jgi:ATP adenylyltransferase
MDCPFCNTLITDRNRVIKETAFSFVILSDPKLMEGHMLVIPKRHVSRPAELSKDELLDWFNETVLLQERVLEKISPGCDISQHFRPFIPDNGLKVSHLHFHVRPRFLDDELFTKVQIHENKVFTKPTKDELNKYKEIFTS